MNGNLAAKANFGLRYPRACLELTKAHLSGYIALSALAGHVLAQDRFSFDSLVLGGWVFMLAAGAGVVNNIQDRKDDRQTLRTRTRVLASRTFPLERAQLMALILTAVALAGLYFTYTSGLPLLLGGTALVCYNGLYTPMKKTGLWAMVPGTVSGMIPPAIGWAAVPKEIAATDLSGLVILMACLGVWQFPHYLLVELKQRGGKGRCLRPSREIRAMVLIWVCLFCLGLALFLIRGWVDSPRLFFPAWALALLLPVVLAGVLGGITPFGNLEKRASIAFVSLNLAMFLFLSLIILDRF